MMHDSLANMLQTNFQMMQHHQYSLHDIENMIPWERQIYIGLLVNHVKEQNEQTKQQEAQMSSSMPSMPSMPSIRR
jgi:hypothetical protein